jgi:translation initiation factor 4B
VTHSPSLLINGLLGTLLSIVTSTSANWADTADEEGDYDDRNTNSSGASRGGSYADDRSDRRGGYERSDRRGGYDRGSDRRDYERSDRRRDEPRPVKDLPDHPPFTAFLGNLSYDVTEDQIGNFFAENCEVKSVRVITDSMTGRPKGYGYIEFMDRGSLEIALSAEGQVRKGLLCV